MSTDTPVVRILVVEDDEALSDILCEELRARRHTAVAARTVADAVRQMKDAEFDVALLDLRLSDGSGMDVLRRIHEEDLATEGIVLTGHAAVDTAIEAMKLGAYDYVTKPARMEELEVLVLKAAEKSSLRRENDLLRSRLEHYEPLEGLVTDDPVMKQILSTLDRVAGSDLPVLLEGETGTGKEVLARAIHRLSPRAGHAFVAINCGAVPENLIESELFGHERGAFTGAVDRKLGLFEAADKGVLFLDEIGDVTPALQVRLLRALESREFFRVGGTRIVRSDVRIVSATHKDLRTEMQAGRFREDLFYRLNGVRLRVPPLRERTADIPLLVVHFLDRFARGRKVSPGTLRALAAYPWPGNIRELQMVIQRAALLAKGDVIEPSDLPLEGGETRNWRSSAVKAGLTLEELEREYIVTVLEENAGHRGKTARALGVDPKTLYNKLGSGRPRTKAGAKTTPEEP